MIAPSERRAALNMRHEVSPDLALQLNLNLQFWPDLRMIRKGRPSSTPQEEEFKKLNLLLAYCRI